MKATARTMVAVLLCLYSIVQLQAQSHTSGRKTTTSSAKIQYGTASFYSNKFNGKKTANGEIFSQDKFTAAHNSLPLGTWIKVTNLSNSRSVLVRVNDRLHPKNKRLVDLSRTAASKLGYTSKGLTKVKVEVYGKKKPENISNSGNK